MAAIDVDRTVADWYRDAVIYELHVRAFADSNGDGIGDFAGLTSKLDYLRDLGVTAIWLLPFYPSPLRDDGYDIAGYRTVNPSYGTLANVRTFLREAHRRGLRVITELVLNHTSDQHPWFQRSRRAKRGSKWRDWYVWSDTSERYRDARIIFGDFETSNWSWDPVASAYFWHRFYSQQPDLNFENPAVRAEMTKVVDFWFDLGVDGLRLDAVPYLFEREGTNCENLPATHDYLRELRAHISRRYPDRMLLAEANQWPEDAAAYFGTGDECHMNFHFPLMPRLFMSLQMEDRFPVIDILEQTPAPPEGCQWALFLRNHDELTLEMVTDEERDYMYRMYAHDRQARINLGIRRRLAPLLEHDRNKIHLLNGILLSLPGTPVMYYGDEIGMGDNVYLGDRNGVRTPMQWSADRNAGFSTANPHRLYLPTIIDPTAHYEAVNVESQLASPSSLLWWTRRILALRKRHPVFGRGDIEFLHPDNRHVLAYLRRLPGDEEVVLVLANLSRHAQYVELDLAQFQGAEPVELFGQTSFPPIGDLPYLVTLGPHGLYWMALQSASTRAPTSELKVITLRTERWAELVDPMIRHEIAQAVRRFLPTQPWYAGAGRRLRDVRVVDLAPMSVHGAVAAAVLVMEASYAAGEAERYVVPIVAMTGDRAAELRRHHASSAVALVRRDGDEAVLFDGMVVSEFVRAALGDVARRRRRKSDAGQLRGVGSTALRALAPLAGDGEVVPLRHQQDNSSAEVGDGLIIKLFRRLSTGRNPDQEVGTHLGDVRFPHAARLVGSLEYDVGEVEPSTVALVHELVPNEGDAFTRSVDELGRRYEWAIGTDETLPSAGIDVSTGALLAAADGDDGIDGADQIHPKSELIGVRLGELHRALALHRGDPAFTPETFTKLSQRALYQSLRNRVQHGLQQLDRSIRALGPDAGWWASVVLADRAAVLDVVARVNRRPLTARRIRVHGDLRLDQILWTGRDVVFLDFEGEPFRAIGERRLKRSAYLDVAGMLRSFEHATWVARHDLVERGIVTPGPDDAIEAVQQAWYWGAGASFLRGYRQATAGAPFVADDDTETITLIDAFCLDRAIAELTAGLQTSTEAAVSVPLAAIARIAGIAEPL